MPATATAVSLVDRGRAAGNIEEARKLFLQSIDILRSLVDLDPTNTIRRMNVSVALNNLASLEQNAGKVDEARKHLRQRIDNDRSLVETFLRRLITGPLLAGGQIPDLERPQGAAGPERLAVRRHRDGTHRGDVTIETVDRHPRPG